MSDRVTVEEAWLEYTDHIYKELNVTPTQIKETRLAFYAGAWAALNMMIDISEQSEMVAIGNIESLRVELEEFLKREIERIPRNERQETQP